MYSNAMVIWGLLVLFTSCVKVAGPDPSRQPDANYNPNLDASSFLAGGTWINTYVVPENGKIFVYGGQTSDGYERFEKTKLPDTLSIDGILCGTILEMVWIDDHLTEIVKEYKAEDIEGNVWTLGINNENFNTAGVLINTHGSWTSGSDGAKPGIAMLSEPVVGAKYREEYYFNVAENQAEVLDTGITITTVMGAFHGCIVIREWSELEPEIFELKMFAPGIGLVKEVNLSTGNEIELIDIK